MRHWRELFQRGIAEVDALGYLDPLRQSKRLATTLGWVGRIGTGLAVASVLFTVVVYVWGRALPAISIYDDAYQGPILGVLVPAFLSACAWAFLLSGAAYIGILPFALVAVYFSYYGELLGFGWRDSWWMLAPNLVVIALIPLALSRQPRTWWRSALAWPLITGAIFLIFQGTPLFRMIPFTYRRLATLVLGVVLTFAAIRSRRTLDARRVTALSPAVVTLGTTLVISAYFLANLLAPGKLVESGQNLVLAFSDLLFVVSVFWFAWGVGLLDWSMSVTQRIVHSTRRLFPYWFLIALTLALWAFEVYAGRVALHDTRLEIGSASLVVSFAWAEALDAHSWLALLLLLATPILLVMRRLRREAIPSLLGFSLLTFLAIYGYQNSFSQLGSEEQQFSLLALLFYVGGFMWDALSGTTIFGEDWESGPEAHPRALLYMGLVLFVAAIATLGILGHWSQFERVASLYPFFGMTYLGGPYLLYLAMQGQSERTGLQPGEALSLFLWGVVTAVPMVALDRGPLQLLPASLRIGAEQLALAVAFFLTVPRAILSLSSHEAETALVPTRRRGFGFVVGGAALGLGYATFRAYPILPPAGWVYQLLSPELSTFLLEAYRAAVDRTVLSIAQDYALHMAIGSVLGLVAALTLARMGQPRGRVLGVLSGLGSALLLLIAGWALRLGYEALWAPIRGWPLGWLANACLLLLPLATTGLCLVFSGGSAWAADMRLPRTLLPSTLIAILLLSALGALYSATTVTRPYQDPSGCFGLKLPSSWPIYQQAPGLLSTSSGTADNSFSLSTSYLARARDARGLAEILLPVLQQHPDYAQLDQGERDLALADGVHVTGWVVEYQFTLQQTVFFGRATYLLHDGLGYALDWWSHGPPPRPADELLYERLVGGLRLFTPSRAPLHFRDDTSRLEYDYSGDWQVSGTPQFRGLSKRFEVGVALASISAEDVPAGVSAEQYAAALEASYAQGFAQYRYVGDGEERLCGNPGRFFLFTYTANGAPMRSKTQVALGTVAGSANRAVVVLLLSPDVAYDVAIADIEQVAATLTCK